jgi:hypothetical protein
MTIGRSASVKGKGCHTETHLIDLCGIVLFDIAQDLDILVGDELKSVHALHQR